MTDSTTSPSESEGIPPTTDTIEGRIIQLSSGASVWGGIHNGSTYWRFVGKNGGVTRLALSPEAVAAMVQLFQGMLGCDPDFAAVTFEPNLPDSASSVKGGQ